MNWCRLGWQVKAKEKEEEDAEEEVARHQAELIVELGFDGQLLNMITEAGAAPWLACRHHVMLCPHARA